MTLYSDPIYIYIGSETAGFQRQQKTHNETQNPVWPEICFRHKAFRKYFRHEQHSQQYEQYLQVNLPSGPPILGCSTKCLHSQTEGL